MFIDPKKKSDPVIWDPFMGTGSTGVAAMSWKGAIFYGSDIDGQCEQVRILFDKPSKFHQ